MISSAIFLTIFLSWRKFFRNFLGGEQCVLAIKVEPKGSYLEKPPGTSCDYLILISHTNVIAHMSNKLIVLVINQHNLTADGHNYASDDIFAVLHVAISSRMVASPASHVPVAAD